jgi:hypothetical protein
MVTLGIIEELHDTINWPADAVERREIAMGFSALGGIHRMPNVAGALDGTLIEIAMPSGDEDSFIVSRGRGKKFHAINVAAIVDARGRYK